MNPDDTEKKRLNLENQIKIAQKHFDANHIEAAENAMSYPDIETREKNPDLLKEWLNLHRAIEQQQVDAYLEASIPVEFRAIDPALYPAPNSLIDAVAFQRGPVIDHTGAMAPGSKGGLLLYGHTGAGKTRAAFAVLTARCKEDPGHRFKYVSAPVLKHRLADAARGGRSQAILEELLDDTSNTLFIDDLSQARFTPAFAENLFELIDRVHREHVDLIVTVQTTGAELVRKWCSDDKDLTSTAQAIVRRLHDYCYAVRFTASASRARHEAPTPPPGGG